MIILVIVRFTEKLASDIEAIEKKTYMVMGKEVTFSSDLLPGICNFWLLSMVNWLIQRSTFPVFLSVKMIVCHLLGNLGRPQTVNGGHGSIVKDLHLHSRLVTSKGKSQIS